MSNKGFQPGEIVAIPLKVGFEHYGIYTEQGTVISSSMRRGGVEEEPIEVFSLGRPITSKGYPSNRPPEHVLADARASIGQPWKLLYANCQHFATACHGDKHSPQLRLLGAVTVVALAAMLIKNRRKYA